jgi:hypothetical protein
VGVGECWQSAAENLSQGADGLTSAMMRASRIGVRDIGQQRERNRAQIPFQFCEADYMRARDVRLG